MEKSEVMEKHAFKINFSKRK